MRASYAALLVMGIVGGPVTRPRMRALNREAERPGNGSVAALVAAASDSVLQLSLHVRVVFGLAVVYLMIAKPDAVAAAIVIGLALILTIVLGVSGSRLNRPWRRATDEWARWNLTRSRSLRKS
jgi:hypothetical protein